jgi:CheY-like chemotaxis protein
MIKKILFIDDDEDDRFLFAEALRSINPAIICDMAEDGLEALKILEAPLLPDYIFLDLNMPVMNGFECLAEIKKNTRLQHIHVIIYSTSKNDRDVERIKNLGAISYIKKPADFKDLCDKIRCFLERDFGSGAEFSDTF